MGRTWEEHVLPMFCACSFHGFSMNNLFSYCGLIVAKIRASDKDLPVSLIYFTSVDQNIPLITVTLLFYPGTIQYHDYDCHKNFRLESIQLQVQLEIAKPNLSRYIHSKLAVVDGSVDFLLIFFFNGGFMIMCMSQGCPLPYYPWKIVQKVRKNKTS